jgi:hypothetical protein
MMVEAVSNDIQCVTFEVIQGVSRNELRMVNQRKANSQRREARGEARQGEGKQGKARKKKEQTTLIGQFSFNVIVTDKPKGRKINREENARARDLNLDTADSIPKPFSMQICSTNVFDVVEQRKGMEDAESCHSCTHKPW